MDDDQVQEHGNGSAVSVHASDRGAATEPVRSRWTPKPEQILILESIFNSGMVNPPKDETVRIRKLLERFGAVGDANVFYWFQNRRSRSRRRQRQLQADLMADRRGVTVTAGDAIGLYEQQHPSCSSSCSSSVSSNYNSCGDGGRAGGGGGGGGAGGGFLPCSSSGNASSYAACFMGGDDGADDLFTISRQMGIMESSQSPLLFSSDASQLHYQAGTITVFINGIASEVPRVPLDLRAVFGPNVMLVHSSGQLLPVNEYGILQHSLQNGESYFLVSAPN